MKCKKCGANIDWPIGVPCPFCKIQIEEKMPEKVEAKSAEILLEENQDLFDMFDLHDICMISYGELVKLANKIIVYRQQVDAGICRKMADEEQPYAPYAAALYRRIADKIEEAK